jgi:hypothetical protein
MTLQQDSSEPGAAGERQEMRSAAVEAGLRALIADAEWHKSDGGGVWRADYERAARLVVEAALPQIVPTQFEVAAKLHGEKHGDGCTFTNPANCDRWHESLREADAILALINRSAS